MKMGASRCSLNSAAKRRGRPILALKSPCTNMVRDATEAQPHVALGARRGAREGISLTASVPRPAAEEVEYGRNVSLLLWPGCAQRQRSRLCACVRWAEGGGKNRQEKRKFGTFTRQLLELLAWLQQCGVTHAVMESTGVYWKPVWHALEGHFELLLANVQHVKAIPGKKTDRRDAGWLAELLQHGWLRSSFVPPEPIRGLRDLTRYRVNLAQECNRIANRIQKVLEDANLKLASVATDPLGASGRAMLKAIIKGEHDVEKLAEMSRGLLRRKIPQLQLALDGRVTEHHRFLLKELIDHLEFVESKMTGEGDRQTVGPA